MTAFRMSLSRRLPVASSVLAALPARAETDAWPRADYVRIARIEPP